MMISDTPTCPECGAIMVLQETPRCENCRESLTGEPDRWLCPQCLNTEVR